MIRSWRSEPGERPGDVLLDSGWAFNAVQTREAREAGTGAFEIIPLVSAGTMKSGSISGELTAMEADNAFAGYIANVIFDLDFMLIENDYKTERTHPTTGSRSARPRASRSAGERARHCRRTG